MGGSFVDGQAAMQIGFQSPACNLNNANSMTNCGNDNQACDHSKDVYVVCEGMLPT